MKFPKIPHWPFLLGPWLLTAIGFSMNALVMAFNGAQMPVLWPGGCTPDIGQGTDVIHTCMTHATHLKFLGDWIVIRDLGVASPGDFFEWAGEYASAVGLIIWGTLVIRDHHVNQSK